MNLTLSDTNSYLPALQEALSASFSSSPLPKSSSTQLRDRRRETGSQETSRHISKCTSHSVFMAYKFKTLLQTARKAALAGRPSPLAILVFRLCIS
jgi:hypothetical protein